MASDVKWIKITTDIFDDEKIILIESLPDSYAIITVWFKLLCLAGKQNNSGVFMMGRVAYTDKMLATIFRMKESTVAMALQTFEQFGMIEIIDGVITIPNWGKHQNLDQLENKKEYMRNYMREYRNKQKALTQNDKLCENGLPLNDWIEVLNFFDHECAYCGCKNGLEQEHIIPVDNGGRYVIGNIVPSCRRCNASKGAKEMQEWYPKSDVFNQERLEKIMMYSCKTNISHLHKANVSQADKEGDKEGYKEERDIKGRKINYQEIVDMYHSLCPSFPSVKILSDARKRAIKARSSNFSIDEFQTVFEKAEASDFLKGANNRNWTANFDWIIKDANMAKILDGNYDNRTGGRQKGNIGVPSGSDQSDLDDLF